VNKTDSAHKTLPPYMSYKAFQNFLDGLRVAGVPTRMDKSLVPSMNGTNQALLSATLRYFGLVTAKGATTEDLDALVNTPEGAREEVWRRLVMKGYANLFASNIDLERTTTDELGEEFIKEGVSSEDTIRKCVTFFTFAAKEAGIKLSPYIKPYAGRRRADRLVKAAGTGAIEARANRNPSLTGDGNGSTDLQSRVPDLPAFDNSWSEKIKERWFDSFDQLLKKIPDDGS
jgi:hypothetical protein